MRAVSGQALGVVAIAALITLGFGACGGDDDDAGAAEPLTKADYIEQADAICADYNAETEALFESADVDLNDPDAMAAFATDELLPRFAAMIESVDELEPPATDTEEIDTLIADTRAALVALNDLLAADPSAALSTEADPFVDIYARMAAYGFVECGRD